MTDALNSLVRNMAEMENVLISVERLHEYTKVPIEVRWMLSVGPRGSLLPHGHRCVASSYLVAVVTLNTLS